MRSYQIRTGPNPIELVPSKRKIWTQPDKERGQPLKNRVTDFGFMLPHDNKCLGVQKLEEEGRLFSYVHVR
jgi:hypothetical protein